MIALVLAGLLSATDAHKLEQKSFSGVRINTYALDNIDDSTPMPSIILMTQLSFNLTLMVSLRVMMVSLMLLPLQLVPVPQDSG